MTAATAWASRPAGIFHVNDYPAIDRKKIADTNRVFPGDGGPR